MQQQQQQYTPEQQLLIDEIILKGYDQDEFQQFVLLIEPIRGQEIEMWTYEELETIVRKFQSQKYQPQASQSFPPAEPIQEINGFQVIDDLSYNTITSQIKDKIKLTDKIILEPYTKSIKCRPQNLLIEGNAKLSFIIEPPKEERGGFFAFYKRAILFPITIEPKHWKVNRTIQDFIALRKHLVAQFPEYMIQVFPIIDQEDFASIQKQQDTIINRMVDFLNEINRIPQLRSSHIFLTFIQETNATVLQTKLHKNLPTAKNFTLQNKQSQSSKVDIVLDQTQYKKFKDYDYFTQNQYSHFENICKHLEHYTNHIAKANDSLQGAAISIIKLRDALPDSENTESCSFQLQQLNCYLVHCLMTKISIKEQNEQSSSLTKSKLQSLFLRQAQQKLKINDFRSSLQEAQQNFVQEYNSLEKRKEDTYHTQKDLTKWGLTQEQLQSIDISRAQFNLEYAKKFMYPKEAIAVQDVLDQYVYMLNHFNTAMDKLLQDLNESLADVAQGLVTNMRTQAEKYLQLWTSYHTELQSQKVH